MGVKNESAVLRCDLFRGTVGKGFVGRRPF